jgi:NADH:ubiquinone oxidoreductase subunit H
VVALAAAAVAVAAQWGSASLRDVATAQARHRAVGLEWLGLPTMVVQPAAFVAALVGTHLLVSRGPAGLADDRRFTGLRRLVWQTIDLVALLVGSAWVAVVFLGGGALPWNTDPSGAATVLGVVACATTVAVVALALSWSTSRWPHQRPAAVERLVLAALVPLVLAGAVAALLGRFWF